MRAEPVSPCLPGMPYATEYTPMSQQPLSRVDASNGEELARKGGAAAVRDYLVPALLGLLVSLVIREHSLSPWTTMHRVVVSIAVLVVVPLVVLRTKGIGISISKPVALAMAAFGVSAAISVVLSGDIDRSLLRLGLYLVIALLGTLVYLLYRRAPALPLATLLIVVGVVHLPHLVGAILWIRDYEAEFWYGGIRVGDFAHVRQYAELAWFAAVSGTGLAVLPGRHRLLAFVLAAAGLFALVMTGSRGATLSWILFVLLAVAFTKARWRVGLHGLLVAAFAAVLVLLLDRWGVLESPHLFRRVGRQIAGNETFDTGRLELWWSSLQQIVKHPLFGSGPEGYWISGCCVRHALQAHNFVLQLLLEFGIIGCGFLALVLVAAVRSAGGPARLWSDCMASEPTRVLCCLLASYLAYSLIDQTMYHLVPLLLAGVFAGLLAAGLAQVRARA